MSGRHRPSKLTEAHWRSRAKEARTLAKAMQNDAARHNMLRVAADYENLAERAKARAEKNRPKDRSC